MGLFQNPFQKTQRMTRTALDMAFVVRDWDQLIRTYRGEWIAVYKEQVIAHASDYETLCTCIRRKGKNPVLLLLPQNPSLSEGVTYLAKIAAPL